MTNGEFIVRAIERGALEDGNFGRAGERNDDFSCAHQYGRRERDAQMIWTGNGGDD